MKKQNQGKLRRSFFQRQSTVLKWNKRKMVKMLRKEGVSEEVLELFGRLWSKTRKIGRIVCHIGKVIVYEFLKFFKKHPGLAAGLAAASSLTIMAGKIPLVGQYIAPYVAVIAFPLFGYIGIELDAINNRSSKSEEFVATIKDFISALRNMIQAIWPKGETSGFENELIPVLAN